VRCIFLGAALVLLCACSQPSDDAGLTGRWVEWDSPHDGSVYDLVLRPDHTFSATVSDLALRCRFPESISDTRGTGRWKFDREALRIDLQYDAPALSKCKPPDLRSIVVDPSAGETDLLLYPGYVAHPGDRVRLTRPRPLPPTLAARRAQTQVECFRARGKWQKWCQPNAYQCRVPFPDAGKPCTDSSQCEGLCLIDMVSVCEPGKECVDPVIPEPGQPAAGICQRDDTGCGSFIEIHKGRADSAYHID
jgi:hypothetical protein